MKVNRENITVLNIIVALIVTAALLLNISSQLAAATSAGCGAGCGRIEETNPLTKNPHPEGEPQGNPHQFDFDCKGNPHGQIKTVSNPECPGAQ